MPSIMLVTNNPLPLKAFLEDKGSIDVNFCYPSLVSEEQSLKEKYYSIDMLVYIQGKDERIYHHDMQILRDLLLGRSFFNPREIIFFSEKPANREATYSMLIMNEVERRAQKQAEIEVPACKEYLFSSEIPFTNIYNAILGRVVSNDYETGMETVFRSERGSDAKASYEPSEDVDLKFEPFSYKGVNNYEMLRETVMKTEKRENIFDEDPTCLDKSNPTFSNIKLPAIDRKICAIVSGNPKTGATTLSVALAQSLSTKVEKVLLIDLSYTKGASILMDSGSVPFVDMSSRDMLTGDIVRLASGVSVNNDCPPSVETHFLKHISLNLTRYGCQGLIINVDAKDMWNTVKLLDSVRPSTFFTSFMDRGDINLARKHLFGCKDYTLVLNKYIESPLKIPEVPSKEIESLMVNMRRYCGPMMFPHLAFDGYLAEMMLGV